MVGSELDWWLTAAACCGIVVGAIYFVSRTILSLFTGYGRHRANDRNRRGECIQCGYDLWGAIERCPECGYADFKIKFLSIPLDRDAMLAARPLQLPEPSNPLSADEKTIRLHVTYNEREADLLCDHLELIGVWCSVDDINPPAQIGVETGDKLPIEVRVLEEDWQVAKTVVEKFRCATNPSSVSKSGESD